MYMCVVSLNITPETDPYASDYPFSVPVDKPITAANLMDIQVNILIILCLNNNIVIDIYIYNIYIHI